MKELNALIEAVKEYFDAMDSHDIDAVIESGNNLKDALIAAEAAAKPVKPIFDEKHRVWRCGKCRHTGPFPDFETENYCVNCGTPIDNE